MKITNMLNDSVKELSNSLDQIETKFLNPCGKLPFIQKFTGGARVMLGTAQTVTGFSLELFAIFTFLAADKYQNSMLRNRSCKQIINGLGNIGRGLVECSTPWAIILLIAYDHGLQKRQGYEKLEGFGFGTNPAYFSV